MEVIQNATNELLVTLALGVITLLAAYATYGLKKLVANAKKQVEKLESDEMRKMLINAIEDVDELTTKTVSTIEQTTAKNLRELVKDGKADKSELEALAKKAALEITESLRPDVKTVIADNFGSFEKYLSWCIETKVLELKSLE